MKLKVVSDGTVIGTKVVAENGEEIDGVISVNWEVAAAGNAPVPFVTLRMINTPVEIIENPAKYDSGISKDAIYEGPVKTVNS